MSLLTRIATCATLLAVTFGAFGCVHAPTTPWSVADKQLAASTRSIADKAMKNDVNYFRGLTVDRQKVPDLVKQVARSGIATNYAEHLEVESDQDAVLVYRRADDITLTTPFSIRLSLNEGELRVEQIVIGDYEKAAASRLGTLVERTSAPESAVGPHVSVSFGEDPLIAGSEESALIGLTNTTDESVRVPRPLEGQLMIIDTAGNRAWAWGSFQPQDTDAAVTLAPFQTAYSVVQFTAPEPASYLVYGRANGVLSPALRVTTVVR